MRKVTRKMPNANPGASIWCEPVRSEMIRNAHGHVTRGILCGNLQGKCCTHRPRTSFCASLHSRNAHGHKRHFCAEIYRENAGRYSRGQHSVRAGATEMIRIAHGHVTRGILCRNLQGKCRTRCSRTSFLCESAQSKCTWTCHKEAFFA